MSAEPDDDVEWLEIEGEMDAHTAEALRLEIRRLAKQHGLRVTEVNIERSPDPPTSG